MTLTNDSVLPVIDMNQLKSAIEADNATMSTITHLAVAGSTVALSETENTIFQQRDIVTVMESTGFLASMWDAFVLVSKNDNLSAADREAFTWAVANAFQRGFMACDSMSKFAPLVAPGWVN